MFQQLRTDHQFEQVYLTQATVYVKDKYEPAEGMIGSVEAFNPIFITVGGHRLLRDDFDFMKK